MDSFSFVSSLDSNRLAVNIRERGARRRDQTEEKKMNLMQLPDE